MTNRIKELEDLIIKHKIDYYASKPTILDSEYDKLEDELKKLNPDSPVLRQIGTPILQDEFKKAKHNIPMGSLEKVNSIENTIEFLNKVGSIVASFKMDGASLEIIYKNGELVQAITRGDGEYGEDVTENAKMIQDIPVSLKKPLNISVRGEVYMKKSIFNKLIKNGLDGSNPRNLASGSLKQLDSKVTRDRFLSFSAFDCIAEKSFKDEMTKYQFLDFIGISHVKPNLFDNKNDIVKYIEEITKIRQDLDFEIDGLVLIANDIEVQKKLGYIHKTPKFGRAYKFAAEEVETVIEKIEWNVGQTGRITPRIHIKPVEIGGVTVTHATGHNLKSLKKMGIIPGSIVLIKRAGDVIPYIIKVIGNPGTLEVPQMCPVCGVGTKEDETFLECNNIDCPEQNFRRIMHGISALEIEEIGSGVLENFVNNGLIKDLADIFILTHSQIASLERLGNKSATNIINQINSKKEIPLSNFINALCIKNIGKEASIEIAKKCKTLENFMDLKSFNCNGFGTKKEKALLEGIQARMPLIEKLIFVGVKVIDVKKEENKNNGKLNGLSFCFTGVLNTLKRSEAEKMVKDLGGTIGGVNKNLTYLITNDTSSGSNKNEKAKQLGIKVIDEDAFLKLIETNL